MGALVLAGCGGGGRTMDAGPTPAELTAAAETALTKAEDAVNEMTTTSGDSTVTTAITAAEAAVNTAETAVNKVPAAQRAELALQLGKLQSRREGLARTRKAAMDRVDQMNMAAVVKKGQDMFAALAGPNPNTQTPLNNLRIQPLAFTPTWTGDPNYGKFTFDMVAGAGALPNADDHAVVTLEPGESAPGLSNLTDSWTGHHYTHTNETNGRVDRTIIYTNRAAPKQVPFADVMTDNTYSYARPNLPPGGNYTLADRKLSLGSTPDRKVAAERFPTTGRKVKFTPTTIGGTKIEVRGTYDGVPGVYHCTGTCTSQRLAGGIALSDDWEFIHDPDAEITVLDRDYLFFGIWLREDLDGMPLAASAFNNHFGSAGAGIGRRLQRAVAGTAINGSATYEGNAVGYYGINAGTASKGGTFTADVRLNTRFGPTSDTQNGLTDTVDGFRLDDGSDPKWSLQMNKAQWSSTNNSIVNTTENSTSTVWTIDGNRGQEGGTWNAATYVVATKTSTGTTTSGEIDPDAILGRFASMHGGTHRMVGAFGASVTTE